MSNSADDRKASFSIYRVRDIKDCADAVRARGYREIPCTRTHRRLFVNQKLKKPKWFGAIEGLTQGSGLGLEDDRQSSFVLLMQTQSHVYAVTGGTGYYAIQAHIVPDFGLDIAVRLLSPVQVRYINRKLLGHRALQEEVTYREYDYELDSGNWGNLVKEILGRIRESDLSAELGITRKNQGSIKIDGKSSLRIGCSLSVSELDTVIERLEDIQRKPPTLDRFTGYREVEDGDLQNHLDSLLLEELNSQYSSFLRSPDDFVESNVYLSYAFPKELLFCDSFQLTRKGLAPSEVRNLDLGQVFQCLFRSGCKRISRHTVTNFTISGTDHDGDTVIEDKLRQFLAAEVRHEQTTYFLVDGKWFAIDEDFLGRIESDFARIQERSVPLWLPAWPIKSNRPVGEPCYIQHACNEDASLLRMHGKQIIVRAGSDPAEVCDLFRLDGGPYLIYVKRGFGSSMRLLLAQTRNSLELIKRNPKFCKEAEARIAEMAPKCGAVNLGEPRVIVAVTDHKLDRGGTLSEKLSTIVKLDVINTVNYLQRDLGVYEVRVIEIGHVGSSIT